MLYDDGDLFGVIKSLSGSIVDGFEFGAQGGDAHPLRKFLAGSMWRAMWQIKKGQLLMFVRSHFECRIHFVCFHSLLFKWFA